MNVFITAINGFIGSALARTLFERGHTVNGSVSATEKLASTRPFANQSFVVRLNEDFDPRVFRGVDTLVHCAHDLRKGKATFNIEGTKRLATAAIDEGVRWQIFISSYSAHEEATTEYGQTKLQLENFFLGLNQIVVRPGLVVGHGGLFLKMCGLMQSYPCVPLIDGGQGKLPIISIHDLKTAVVELIENPRKGCFRLSNAKQISLKELMVEIKRAGRFRTLLIPVPVQLIYLFLWTSQKLGLHFQVDIGNLKGFQANQSLHDSSDLNRFVPQPMSMAEMIEAALKPK